MNSTVFEKHADRALDRRAAPVITAVARKIFSFPVVIGGLLSVLAVLTTRSRFDDPDMWWHLKTGEIIWTTRSIPTADLFSYTARHQAWIPQEWLSQTLIYAAYRADGYSGLMLWLLLLTMTVLIAGYVLCSLYSKNAKIGFLGAITIWFFATSGLAVRPQMIGYSLLIFLLLIIHLGRTRSPFWFFALPPLFALWVNCHGSFFLGIVVCCLFLFSSLFEFRMGLITSSRWQSQRQSVFGLAMLASLGALFLNPAGAHQILYPLDTMLRQPLNLRYVTEWAPLQFPQSRAIGVAVILALIFLVVAVRRTQLSLDELLLLGAGTCLAETHARMTFVFGILAAPVLARILAGTWDRYDPAADRPLLNAAMIAFSLFLVIQLFPGAANLDKQVERGSPVKAVEYIQTHHLSGNMLNEYVFGGYLIWAAPQHPVFIDGRADIYEWSGVLQQFARWASLEENPNLLLNRYHISFCLLARNSLMTQVLPLLPGWKQIYSDPVAVIFSR